MTLRLILFDFGVGCLKNLRQPKAGGGGRGLGDGAGVAGVGEWLGRARAAAGYQTCLIAVFNIWWEDRKGGKPGILLSRLNHTCRGGLAFAFKISRLEGIQEETETRDKIR